MVLKSCFRDFPRSLRRSVRSDTTIKNKCFLLIILRPRCFHTSCLATQKYLRRRPPTYGTDSVVPFVVSPIDIFGTCRCSRRTYPFQCQCLVPSHVVELIAPTPLEDSRMFTAVALDLFLEGVEVFLSYPGRRRKHCCCRHGSVNRPDQLWFRPPSSSPRNGQREL